MELIRPDWPAPARVQALITTRAGGVSRGAWQSLNLGDHVGDDPAAVAENRRRLGERLAGGRPRWLRQVHGVTVVNAAEVADGCEADAAFARAPGVACTVMTADCLPVLFCDREGLWVAAAHAGWRGLADGVLETTLKTAPVPPGRIMAFLGPAIGPDAFEVGDEVRERFVAGLGAAARAFRPSPNPGRWLADLYALARLRLQQAGVAAIHGGGWCTFRDAGRFFSYRRDGVTGRMASLIWLSSSPE